MFLHAGPTIEEHLLRIYNDILLTGQPPLRWKESLLILLPKGGNPEDPGNWRPIAILDTSYKIMARMLYNKLQENLEANDSEYQFGFRRGRSRRDAILVLENLAGKSFEWNTPIWIASLDLRKAIDRVEHKALLAALERHGVNKTYLRMLRQL